MGDFARKVLGWKKPTKTRREVDTKKRAHEIRAVNELSYFRSIVSMLEEVAHAPVIVSDKAAAMAEQVGKQNAYRELLLVFKKDLKTAERMISEDHARQRGR